MAAPFGRQQAEAVRDTVQESGAQRDAEIDEGPARPIERSFSRHRQRRFAVAGEIREKSRPLCLAGVRRDGMNAVKGFVKTLSGFEDRFGFAFYLHPDGARGRRRQPLTILKGKSKIKESRCEIYW